MDAANFSEDSSNSSESLKKTFTNAVPLMQRPAYPVERLAKRRASFQFPKTILQVANAPWAALSNRGKLFHPAPKCHVVMCGFPRSGTTLCQLMVQACVPGVQCFPKEEMAMQVARFVTKRKPYLFTKRPKDIFQIEDLRAFYQGTPTQVRFILFTRDPRAVLTSFHEMRKGEYYVSVERWRAIWEHWNWAVHSPDVLVIRFEDLVADPDSIEAKISAHAGWQVERPFSQFHKAVPTGFDTRALNGVRPLDPAAIARWQAPKHHARLLSLLEEMPELPQRLIDLGYETNEGWIEQLGYKRRAA